MMCRVTFEKKHGPPISMHWLFVVLSVYSENSFGKFFTVLNLPSRLTWKFNLIFFNSINMVNSLYFESYYKH